MSPFESVARWSSGNLVSGGGARLRQLRSVGAARGGLVFAEGDDLERVVAVGEPAVGRGAELGRGRRLRALQPGLVEVGRAGPDLALGQQSDLPPKPPMRSMPRTKPARGTGVFTRRAPPCVGPPARSRASSSLIARSTLLRSPPGRTVASMTNRPPISLQVGERADVGRDLLVVHQPLEEPGRFPALSTWPSSSRCSASACPTPARSRSCRAGLRHPVLHDRAGSRCAWRSRLPAGPTGGPEGMSPKYCSTLAFTSAGFDVAGDDQHRVAAP